MMPRFAANLTMLWAELPFLERFGAARRAGFAGVEVLFPYDCPAPQLLDRLDATGMRMVLINCPPPNYTEGPRGFAAVPGLEERFRHDFRRAARYAAALGAEHVHVMAGVAEGARARETFVANLAWAAAAAPRQSITVEPINRHDLPGYYLGDFDLALEVIAEVGAPNLRLQFDAYHAHRITGDVPGAWDRCRAHVAHVQVAGAPGRHEPRGRDGGNEVNYPAFFDRLDADGYAGWVSGEYNPKGRTEDGLGWMG
jgi:hydroxypyruvate isomerase